MLTDRRLRTNRRRRLLLESSGPPQPVSFSSVVFQDTWNDRLVPSQATPSPEVSDIGAAITYTGNVSCVDNLGLALDGDISMLRFVTGGARTTCPDIASYTIGASDFWMEAIVYWPSGSSTLPSATGQSGSCIFSHYLNTGNQRGWYWSIEADGAIIFAGSTDGTNQDIVAETGNLSWANDTYYHLVVSRENGVIRIFRDGVEQALVTETNPGGTFFNSTSTLTCGFLFSGAGFQRHFIGQMAHTRIGVGEAVYTADYTAMTQPHPTSQAEIDAR